MQKENNPYQQLLAKGFSKQEIHGAIHKYIMQEIACKKAYQQLSLAGKMQWQVKKYSGQVIGCCKNLTAKGLVLLKTLFAKKPKQPV